MYTIVLFEVSFIWQLLCKVWLFCLYLGGNTVRTFATSYHGQFVPLQGTKWLWTLRVQSVSADSYFVSCPRYEVTNLVKERSVPKVRSVQGTKCRSNNTRGINLTPIFIHVYIFFYSQCILLKKKNNFHPNGVNLTP